MSLLKKRVQIPNYYLLNIHRTTDFQLRFAELDLDYYRQLIPPKQFQLLMNFIGIYTASEDFNPEELFYPEDL